MSGKVCPCGRNCPYTDWTTCEDCTEVQRLAGKETAPGHYIRRANYERRMAATCSNPIVREGHEYAAEAYDREYDLMVRKATEQNIG